VLDGGSLHRVGIGSRVRFICHVLPFHYLLLHRFVYRRVCVRMENSIGHTLIFVLIRVYLRVTSFRRGVEVGVIHVLHNLSLLGGHGGIRGSDSLGLSASCRS
jgi:hypothetical protein